MARSAVSRARSTQRTVVAERGEGLAVVLLGGRPLAAPLVDATELALEAGDVLGADVGGGPLVAGDRVGEATVERLEVADGLVELGDGRVDRGRARRRSGRGASVLAYTARA